MMGKRKVFLLFLSAMAMSFIIIAIIYSLVIKYRLFIKDFDEFNLKAKTPESAPSPIDEYGTDGETLAEDDEARSPAKVSTPDQVSPAAEPDKSKAEEAAEETLPAQEEEPLTEVVPLEPQVGNNPGELGSGGNNQGEDNKTPQVVDNDAVPTLHYVYLDGFSSKNAAEQAIKQLEDRSLVAHPYIRQHKGQIILQFGVFSDRENAETMAQQLRQQNVFVKVD